MLKRDRSMGRVLITGVPGWLADAFLRSLRQNPMPGLTTVRCLTQSTHWPTRAQQDESGVAPLEYVVGDLRDRASLGAAAEGVDVILHAAGVLHVRRTRDWYEANTGGTERLLEAAEEAHVARFVLVSSNAAAGRSECPDRLLTESDPARPLSHYGKSKWLAEEAVRARHGRMETVVLRPCMFYGPPVPERHVRFYRSLSSGLVPLVGGGGFVRSLSYVDNVVQGCRLALTQRAASGQTFFISDRLPYTTRQIVEAMAAALGVRPRYLRLPGSVGRIAFQVDQMVARLGYYWQSLHLLGESDWHVGVSCEKARTLLGYDPTVDLDEGMRRAVAWCRAAGKLR